MLPVKDNLKSILYDCLTSTKTTANVLFSHHCYRPFGAAHIPIFNILDDDSIRRALIVCPRGFGKTTLAGLIFPAKKILFRDCNYIVYISATASKAVADLQTLATELQTNEKIKKLFGDVKGVRWAEGTGELIVDILGKSIKVEAKGAGHQIRGLKYMQYRPDLYIIDDLEESEQVENEVRRKKLKRWFFSDLLNSEDFRGARVLMLGTLLHEDSLIANILDEQKWEENLGELDDKVREEINSERFISIRIEACNDKLEATWPDYMSTDKVRAKYRTYEMRGLLADFYREFRNLIVPTEGASFRQEDFKSYKEDWKTLNVYDNVVIVDPAKTTNMASDDSAIIGIAFNTSKNKLYIRDTLKAKLHPEQVYKEACDMADRLGTYIIGVEVTSLNEFITYPFASYIATRPRHYELVPLKAKGKAKTERIRALVPFYRMGAIYHNEDIKVKAPLESQLLVFPNGKKDDLIDAEAYMIEMFDLGNRLFTFQVNAESEPDPVKRQKMIDDEFAILAEGDYDKPFESSIFV